MVQTNGLVITTVRVHAGLRRGQSVEEAVGSFRERAASRWRRWQPFVGLERQAVSAMAEQYARRMISNPIGSVDNILNLFADSFSVEYTELEEVPGELYPTQYLRLVLRAK
jgi:hypothetical protein